eukprot:1965830-Pyramimonas_sp.AAC.1
MSATEAPGDQAPSAGAAKKCLRLLLSFSQSDSVVSHSMALPRDSATALGRATGGRGWGAP